MMPFVTAGLAILDGMAQRGAQKANNILYDAEAKAANVVREGKNIENAAKASFAGFMANMNNQRALDAAGKAEQSARTNLGRLTDVMVNGSIEDQIANAEGAGAYAASVAMAGGGGGSVDSISRAMALKQQRTAAYTKTRNKQLSYDALQQIAGIVPQTIAGLDIGTYSSAVDYSTALSKARKPQGNWLLDATRGFVAGGGSSADLDKAAAFFK